MIGQFMLGLSILVGIHELGHMLFAKLFGMRVEKFSIGFGPVLFWYQGKETKYQFCLLPLGGFVKISGMVDESLDTANLSKQPEVWEFRSKPTWQRLLVMLGGIIFNIVLGCVIFSSLTYKYGSQYISLNKLTHGLYVGEYGERLGMQNGDMVDEVNGQKVTRLSDLSSLDVLFEEGSSFTVDRAGRKINIPLPDTMIAGLQATNSAFLVPNLPFKVSSVSPGSEADKAHLKSGDQITSINDENVEVFADMKDAFNKIKGQDFSMSVLRDGDTVALKGHLGEKGVLGFIPEMNYQGIVDTTKYGLIAAIPVGTKDAFMQIIINLKGLAQVFEGKIAADKAATGIVGMTKLYGDEFRAKKFWSICGMLSMALALFNLFPVPGLDGGHVVFLLYEMVIGKKPSIKFQEIALKVGFVLLITLMLLVNINDIVKHFN